MAVVLILCGMIGLATLLFIEIDPMEQHAFRFLSRRN